MQQTCEVQRSVLDSSSHSTGIKTLRKSSRTSGMAYSEDVYLRSKTIYSKIDYSESSDSGIVSDSDEESVESEEDYGRKFDEALR